jgi:hypothetical protein
MQTRFLPVAVPWLEPVVDAGGASHKGEMQELLGRKIETWDSDRARDVDKVIDLETCKGIPKGYAGTLICTSVLEHVRHPWLVAEQIARVVHPGGLVFVTAPWIFPIHEHPGDYWRYTLEGLRVLFGEAFAEVAAGTFTPILEEREGVWFMGRRKQ